MKGRCSLVDSHVTKRLLSLSLVVFGLAVLTVAFSGGAVAQEVQISLQPNESEVAGGGETTISVVVEGAESGVGAYNLEVGSTSPAVTITNATLTEDPALPNTQIAADGSAVILTAAMGPPDSAHGAAEEITIAELTVQGQTVGESAALFVGPGPEVGPIDTSAGGYTVSGISNATVTVVDDSGDGTTDSDTTDGDTDGDGADGNGADGEDNDGSGPGIGIAGALLAVLGALLLLNRQ